MVEYAILNAGVALKVLAARVTTFAASINWHVVLIVAAALFLLRLMLGGRRRV